MARRITKRDESALGNSDKKADDSEGLDAHADTSVCICRPLIIPFLLLYLFKETKGISGRCR